MAEISWPFSATPSEFTLARSTKVFRGTSVFGRSGQNLDFLNDRWTLSCTIDIRDKDEGAELEAFINSLRSGAGIVLCHHFARPEIAGVLTNPLTQALSIGSQNLRINCAIGDYLKAGDMLGVGDQLFQVALDCTNTTGVLTVPITLRNRRAIAEGLTVITSRPTAKFRLSSAVAATFGPGGVIMSTSLELVEA